MANIKIMETTRDYNLLKRCNNNTKELGALKIVEEDINQFIEEIKGRKQLMKSKNETMTSNNEIEQND